MSYMSTATITRLRARIARKEAQADTLDDELDGITKVSSYRFIDGEGSLFTEYRSAHEIRNNIRILEKEIDALYRKLAGTGIVSIQLRRRE